MSARQRQLPSRAHSRTSLMAAVAYASRAPNARRRVYDLLKELSGPPTEDGLTDEEIQDALRMNPSTQRPRRIELTKAGLVEDSGNVRATRSGSDAVVWTVTCKPYPEKWPKR